jgi:hypothetical protein
MINKRLRLAVLAQSLIDAIEADDDELIETALMHLSAYPFLLNKLNNMRALEKRVWRASIERALGRSA